VKFRLPEPLGADHDLKRFDCGRESLNAWLTETAPPSEARGNARTYVCVEAGGARVIAYHSLAAGSVRRADAKGKLARNSPDPIPVVVLARLAVDQEFQGQGIGSLLLLDAIERAVSAAQAIGARAMIVNPIDEAAAAFYESCGFTRSKTDETFLYVDMATAKNLLESAGR
jgi:ribosomal protein S18 acetylase RimI-like enzyme